MEKAVKVNLGGIVGQVAVDYHRMYVANIDRLNAGRVLSAYTPGGSEMTLGQRLRARLRALWRSIREVAGARRRRMALGRRDAQLASAPLA